ncbi:hypothetical protein OG271_17435 [Micromonospora rifamycinica]|uniref:amino acid permease C-terminal domain-containing protein n=1 Tax=Micromonospora rifamycinica TaxID=291594 RepID=UPI002E2986D6|nr:amino acid permease C-terminal domain-containing protein [Micromonospora rifamycinica]
MTPAAVPTDAHRPLPKAIVISFLDHVTWLRFAVWFLLGGLVYTFYGYRRSALAGRDGTTPPGS